MFLCSSKGAIGIFDAHFQAKKRKEKIELISVRQSRPRTTAHPRLSMWRELNVNKMQTIALAHENPPVCRKKALPWLNLHFELSAPLYVAVARNRLEDPHPQPHDPLAYRGFRQSRPDPFQALFNTLLMCAVFQGLPDTKPSVGPVGFFHNSHKKAGQIERQMIAARRLIRGFTTLPLLAAKVGQFERPSTARYNGRFVPKSPPASRPP